MKPKTITLLLIALVFISGCGNSNFFIENELEGIGFCENKNMSYSSRDYCAMTSPYTMIRCKDNNNEVSEYKIECKPK